MTSHCTRRLLAGLLLLPSAAFAHSVGETASFVQGFIHPLGGLDHVLAMVAVGVIASRFEGRRQWVLPLTFVAAMAVGGVLATASVSLPLAEAIIALSIVVFGLAIAATRTVNFGAAAAVVAAFALFHGNAHGSEMAGASLGTYSAGFSFATAMLHGLGLFIAVRMRAVRIGEWTAHAASTIRFGGSAMALTGLALFGIAIG